MNNSAAKHIVIDARMIDTSSGTYLKGLLKYLSTLDSPYRYTVLVPTSYLSRLQLPLNFTLEPSDYALGSIGEQTGLLRQLQRLKPDLVHFGFVQQPILYRGRAVTTMHDLTAIRFDNPTKNRLMFKAKQAVYKRVNLIAARKSAAVITPTEYVRQDVAHFAGIDEGKITVTYEAADPIADAPEPVEALQGKQFIMYVGRPQPHKNLERLIEAFNILKQSHPGLVLAFAGKKDALYEQIANRAERAGVRDIVFTGFVSDGQLRWMYENTAAYCFPSLSEGFGLPGLEAMVHGAPVASSNATCLPEVYKDGAHYFDPLNVQDMADKITEILDNEKLKTELITKGKKVASLYSWRHCAEQTLEVYSKALR